MSVSHTSHMNTTDKISTTSITASGTIEMVPAMGRRNYIKIQNIGSVIVEVGGTDFATVSGAVGYQIAASGGTWEDNTDAPIYVKSTGANSELRVYERATR